MSLDSIFGRDLAALFRTEEFAIRARIVRQPFPSVDVINVDGVFDPGFQGDQEPRSPFFRARESDLNAVRHGDIVLIDWTNYDTELTGEIVYYVQGYQPDGWGTARLLLDTRTDISGLGTVQGAPLRHGRRVDPCAVVPSQFTLLIDDCRHARPVDEPELLVLLVAIDASADAVSKVGNVVSSVVAVDGRTYVEQGGGGVTHGDGTTPTGLDRYAFDGSLGSYLLAQNPDLFGQPFTAFVVIKRDVSDDMQFFDNL